MLLYYLLAIGLPLSTAINIRKKRTGNSTFNFQIKDARVISYSAIGGIALLFGLITPLNTLIPVPDVLVEAMRQASSGRGIFTLLLMAIAAPVLEELIFRGVILDGLLKQHAPAKSIVFSSFLFGIVHLNPWQFVTGFLLGLFVGWVYYRSKSISLAIIIHASANLAAYIMRTVAGGLDLSGDGLLEMYGGAWQLLVVMGCAIVLFMICLYQLHRLFPKEKQLEYADNAHASTQPVSNGV